MSDKLPDIYMSIRGDYNGAQSTLSVSAADAETLASNMDAAIKAVTAIGWKARPDTLKPGEEIVTVEGYVLGLHTDGTLRVDCYAVEQPIFRSFPVYHEMLSLLPFVVDENAQNKIAGGAPKKDAAKNMGVYNPVGPFRAIRAKRTKQDGSYSWALVRFPDFATNASQEGDVDTESYSDVIDKFRITYDNGNTKPLKDQTLPYKIILVCREAQAKAHKVAAPDDIDTLGMVIEGIFGDPVHEDILEVLSGLPRDRHEAELAADIVSRMLTRLQENVTDPQTGEITENPNYNQQTVDAINALGLAIKQVESEGV